MFGQTVQEWMNTPQADAISFAMGVAWCVAYGAAVLNDRNKRSKKRNRTRGTELVRREN